MSALALADDVALFNDGKVEVHEPAVEVLGNEGFTRAARLIPPLVLQMGLMARKAGLLKPTDALPKTAADGLPLFNHLIGGNLMPTGD